MTMMSQYRTHVVVDDDSSSRAASAAHLLSASFSSNAAAAPLGNLAGQLWKGYQSSQQQHKKSANEHSETNDTDDNVNQLLVRLEDYLHLPDGYQEWSIPEAYRLIRDPAASPLMPRGPRTTVLFTHANEDDDDYATTTASEMGGRMMNGVEAVETLSDYSSHASTATPRMDPELLLPKLIVQGKDLIDDDDNYNQKANADQPHQHQFCYIPVLALRRQRLGEEERFHEDPAITDIAVSFQDRDGQAVWPQADGDDDEDEEEGTFSLLGKTAWSSTVPPQQQEQSQSEATMASKKSLRGGLGMPVLLVRRNLPFGYADAAFATRVLGRFPFHNYKGLP